MWNCIKIYTLIVSFNFSISIFPRKFIMKMRKASPLQNTVSFFPKRRISHQNLSKIVYWIDLRETTEAN